MYRRVKEVSSIGEAKITVLSAQRVDLTEGKTGKPIAFAVLAGPVLKNQVLAWAR